MKVCTHLVPNQPNVICDIHHITGPKQSSQTTLKFTQTISKETQISCFCSLKSKDHNLANIALLRRNQYHHDIGTTSNFKLLEFRMHLLLTQAHEINLKESFGAILTGPTQVLNRGKEYSHVVFFFLYCVCSGSSCSSLNVGWLTGASEPDPGAALVLWKATTMEEDRADVGMPFCNRCS